MARIPKIKLTIAVSLLAVSLCLCLAAQTEVICLKEFTFDEDKSLDKWHKVLFTGEVDYTLMKYGDNGYVQAVSENTCSALYYRIGFKLKDYPLLRWKWRALEFPDISKATTEKEKDDYAARVYVIFPFLSFSSSKFLEYVWSEDMPVGTIIDSPFGKNIKILVVRSGKAVSDEWVNETRNLYEDYIEAFGEEPKKKAGAIAIMCDADSTKTSAKSLFDDIVIEGQGEL